ncbi:transglycosylase SLT domain-containing protein [Nocardioides sp. L-11A]|uniref:lytic transglycosylase domain-containing protein n=1 Tax=Nocardioides sp. L-11A TaxID=3043848 RepID=UPI00249A2CC8|nr:transglycosylase SLT domain-containing protein [Nocardioides sp. L-11A]
MPGPRPTVALVAAAALLAACGGDPAPRPTTRTPAPATSSVPPAPPPAPTPPPAAKPGLTAPALATTPDELARRLVAAEDAVRAPGADEGALEQAAFETQVLYRQLARRAGWQDAVLDAAGPYRDTMADHIEARGELRSVLTRLSGQVPAWRIVAPAPLADLRAHFEEGERRFGVPWPVLAAVNLVETGFGKIRGFSTAGARGPMQFMPATWARYGEGDIDDPRDSILAAARYLAANGGDRADRLDAALHAYNRHTGYVRGIRAYARILERDPGALAGLYRWQILYLSEQGDLWLPRGYRQRSPLPVTDYLARHPDRHLGTATG